MKVERIAAFCDGGRGGNPAGVVLCTSLPDPAEMQAIAARVGYSETVFAAPLGESWRVRYFAPEMEVPFCGHATIALGALFAVRQGGGVRKLLLNEAQISVEGICDGENMGAALQSPPASSRAVATELVTEALRLFTYQPDGVDPRLPPAMANAGNNHLVLALRSRELLSRMAYDLPAGRTFMLRAGITTVSFIFAETPQLFHVRNPFASGGVYEDPATGSAAAALGGYLSDIAWPSGGAIEILQGEDMGVPSRITVEMPDSPERSMRVSGRARFLR
ncbi:PhzF family phenazine biosynthesis protein [Caballeronia mineralivorans]|jgi:PhzF family phenazine biosynthesis protein|uniref:PhzF family phenazine biosynthesis protein n=1 Tax=Caballeronia mineralivorans TaxID=2010198 RepID=UPI0023F1EEFF|nr:PhzF family phenazine biosynthesis protein [Caballeronia mineralivorans]MDB5782040.1 PhzF family phenazine biosynthesis protein [Caballeronia mineralivorans]